MSTKARKILKVLIPLLLGVVLIVWSYNRFNATQIQEIKTYFLKANYWIIALSVALILLSHFVRAYRWNFLLAPLGFKPKLLNNLMAVAIAYLMNVFIPKSGEVSRALVLDKYEHVAFEKAFGTIISERIIDLVFLFLFTAVALFVEFEALSKYLATIIKPSQILLSLTVLLLFGIGLLWLIFKVEMPLFLKLRRFLIGLKEGIFSVLKMSKKWAFLWYSFLIWALYFFSFWLALHALPETSAVSFGVALITFVVGSFAFAFTNSGFGSYPIFVAGILLVFQIPETVGVAFGWILWTSQIGTVLCLGIFALLALPIYNRKKV